MANQTKTQITIIFTKSVLGPRASRRFTELQMQSQQLMLETDQELRHAIENTPGVARLPYPDGTGIMKLILLAGSDEKLVIGRVVQSLRRYHGWSKGAVTVVYPD